MLHIIWNMIVGIIGIEEKDRARHAGFDDEGCYNRHFLWKGKRWSGAVELDGAGRIRWTVFAVRDGKPVLGETDSYVDWRWTVGADTFLTVDELKADFVDAFEWYAEIIKVQDTSL